MVMKRKMLVSMLGVCMTLGVVHSASALTIESTSNTSGGNPGGLTIYQVNVGATDAGQSFDLHWGYTSSSDDVSATGSFNILKYADGQFDLGFSLKNTSTVTDSSNPRLTAFGFNMDPNLELVSVDYGADNKLKYSGSTHPGSTNFAGFQTIDFCVFAGPNCDGGGNNGLLAEDEEDTFVAHFSGDLPESLSISDFAMKFQGVNSYELPGQPDCENDCTTRVPEPGTALLLGVGLLGFGLSRKAIF